MDLATLILVTVLSSDVIKQDWNLLIRLFWVNLLQIHTCSPQHITQISLSTSTYLNCEKIYFRKHEVAKMRENNKHFQDKLLR